MPVAISVQEAERHLSDPGLDALVLDVGLPHARRCWST